MYDIQNALRRRALAERLEALRHAADAAERATSAAAAKAELEAAAEAQARPRHLADDLSLPPSDGGLYDEAPPAPYAAQPPTPYMTPPSTPYAPPPPPYAADELVAVGAPDQTSALEVQPPRADRPAPAPRRPGVTDRAVPPLEPIDLPLDDPAPAEAAPAAVDTYLDRPLLAGSPAEEAAESPVDGDASLAADLDDDSGSPAAAIADLLRQGGSSLFFQRNAG